LMIILLVCIFILYCFLLVQESKSNLAVYALESLVTHSSNPQHLLTALRCLIRLMVRALENGDNKQLVQILVATAV